MRLIRCDSRRLGWCAAPAAILLWERLWEVGTCTPRYLKCADHRLHRYNVKNTDQWKVYHQDVYLLPEHCCKLSTLVAFTLSCGKVQLDWGTTKSSWHWPPNTSDSNPNNHHVPGQAWSTGTSLHIPDNGKDLMENLSEQDPGRTPELLGSFTLQLVRAVMRSTQYLILVVLMADCCTDKSMRWRQQKICSKVRVNRHQH